jgi:hypothetical protein
MSSYLKNDLEKDFVAAVYLSKSPTQTDIPPPGPHPVTHCIRRYLNLFTQGRGGEVVLNQREGESKDHRAAGSKIVIPT